MAEYYTFAGDYMSGMDRNYEPADVPMGQMPINKIGISANPMKDQLEQLKARIFQGASQVELGWMGSGKGSAGQGAFTPEMYGHEQREAIRDLAKINEIELTTHGWLGQNSLSGFNPQQGKFAEESQANALHEIKRAVEFAADTARGGPIVVHTGEWHRPFSDAEKSEEYKGRFEGYADEDKKASIYAVNEKTGQITGIPKDVEVWQPKIDEKGEYIHNKETGVAEMEMLKYDDILKRAKLVYPKAKSEEEAVIRFVNDANIKKQEAEALRWAEDREHAQSVIDDIEEKKQYWKELEERTPKDKQELLRNNFIAATGMKPKEGESLTALFDESKRKAERTVTWAKEISAAAAQQVEAAKRDVERIKPIEEVGIKKTANAISDAAMYAYDVEKMKKLEKPLFIAPENIFPESGYGSHPQELKKIILESRKAMQEKLQHRGFKQDEAKKIAEDHVKATFDIGHAYTWRRLFKGSDPTDIEQTNKEFKKWALDQVKDLVKSNVIGHVHISDNFGYYDEHVTPGQGIVPIKEFVDEIKKGEKISINVEPAHQDFQALLGAWDSFGSSIYSALVPAGVDRWTEVQNSYFGSTGSPNYLVGEEIRPSEDWALWSGTRIE